MKKKPSPKRPQLRSVPSAGSAFRSAVLERFEALRPDELELLNQAAGALDRIAEAALEVERHGILLPGRTGLKMNPALVAERDHKLLFSRLVKQLGLEDEPELVRDPLELAANLSRKR